MTKFNSSLTSHFNLLKTRNNVLLPISSNKNIKFVFTDGVGLGRHFALPSIFQWVWFYHVIKHDASVQFRAKNERSLEKNPLEPANTWKKVKCCLRLFSYSRYRTVTSLRWRLVCGNIIKKRLRRNPTVKWASSVFNEQKPCTRIT